MIQPWLYHGTTVVFWDAESIIEPSKDDETSTGDGLKSIRPRSARRKAKLSLALTLCPDPKHNPNPYSNPCPNSNSAQTLTLT